VSSCEKLPPCLIKPVPAGSKMDPLLPKAEPISNGGSASVITYLRKGRKNSVVKMAVWREECDCVREKTLQTPRSLKKERGEEVPEMLEQRPSLAACDEDNDKAGCPLAVHGDPLWSGYPPAAHGRDPVPEQVDA